MGKVKKLGLYKIDAKCALLPKVWSNMTIISLFSLCQNFFFDIVSYFIMPSIISNVQQIEN